MDRRLIDLEMAGFEDELGRRNITLDIPQADRMRYWLAGWKFAYDQAYGTDKVPDLNLTKEAVGKRIADLVDYIEDRRAQGDEGRAEIYENWLRAFRATFELAVGEPEPAPRRRGRPPKVQPADLSEELTA